MAIYRVVTKIILFQITAVVEDDLFGNGLLAKFYFSVREARGIPRPPNFDNKPVHVFIECLISGNAHNTVLGLHVCVSQQVECYQVSVVVSLRVLCC